MRTNLNMSSGFPHHLAGPFDHSRYAPHASAHPRITAATVVATFNRTAAEHGDPA
jgi:hypothetical protein